MESIDFYDERKVQFNKALTPGIITAAVLIIFSIVMSMFNLEIEQMQKFGYISWLIIIPLLAYFSIEYRKNDFDNVFEYRHAFVFLFYIVLIFSFLISIYSYIDFKFINTDSIEKILIASEEQMYKQGKLTQSQIDSAVNIQSKFMTPFTMTISSFFSSVIIGTILSLIIAIFTKRKQKL